MDHTRRAGDWITVWTHFEGLRTKLLLTTFTTSCHVTSKNVRSHVFEICKKTWGLGLGLSLSYSYSVSLLSQRRVSFCYSFKLIAATHWQLLYTAGTIRLFESTNTGVDKGGRGPSPPNSRAKKNFFVKIEELSSFTWSVLKSSDISTRLSAVHLMTHNTHPFKRPFVRDYPGEPVPER